MKILHIATEMYPICKAGGLGDVIGALAKEQVRQGDHVCVALPYYHFLQLKKATLLGPIHFGASDLRLEAWLSEEEGCQILLIQDKSPSQFFERGEIYGEHDDTSRFCCFSSAVMHVLRQRKELIPDVIHLHDWPASFAAMFNALEEFESVSFIFTIHNPETQGTISLSTLAYFCVPLDEALACSQQVNGMAEAIKRTDFVTTVSPRYGSEIQEEPAGKGLAHLFRERTSEGCFHGILNGLDLEVWNPATDRYLLAQYGKETLSFTSGPRVSQKEKNFRFVVEKLGLSWRPEQPFACSISRLCWQKGIDLIEIAARWIVEQGGTFVCLGMAYEEGIKRQMEALDQGLRPFGCCILEKNEELVHQLLGGSDLFLMPSLFEPCGLTQMMALRYGSLPIVRCTGGLADTVFDLDFSDQPKEKRNGFVFMDPNQEGVLSAVKRSFEKWRDPSNWRQAIRQAIHFKRGWEEAASQFYALYRNRMGSLLRD
ncbi:glycogen synthase [Candidatus Similichlamydia laticola]|nr:glycogen/starch synthase [Candidatus Similichlamydia laticola]